MKKLFTLSLVLMMAFTVKSIAAPKTMVNLLADSVHKKIKHPTVAMTDEQLTVILNAMRQKTNDADKEQVLKDGVKDNAISIDQLLKLLNQFLTDNSKLHSAEYAFPYTTNYKAFLRIMDIFSQEQYKYELEDYYDKNKK